jgi:hypothetical protein
LLVDHPTFITRSVIIALADLRRLVGVAVSMPHKLFSVPYLKIYGAQAD